jgi:hypothetical protein
MKLAKGLLFGCLFVCCVPASAQDVECAKDQSIGACVGLHVFQYSRTLREQSPGARIDGAEKVKETANASAKSSNNAAETGDQPGTASAGAAAKSPFTDLIPWLNMLGVLSDSDESDGTIAVDLNFLVQRGRRENVKHDSQLKWELDVSPTTFGPLIEAVPEGVREERKKELQEKIKDTADSRLQYSFSYINKKLGRDFRQHQREFAALVSPFIFNASDAAVGMEFDQKRAAFASGLTDLLKPMVKAKPDADNKAVPVLPQTLVGELSAADQKKLIDFIVQARSDYALALASRLDAMQRAVADKRVTRMAELVLQQPQILLTATRSFRDELVGPESLGIKLTYEKSLIDLNGFLKSARRFKAVPGATATPMCEILGETNPDKLATTAALEQSKSCLAALDAFLEANEEQIENKSRWKASLEFKQVEDWGYALPADGVDLDLPKHDRLIASVGFGRALTSSNSKDRIDFDAAYDSNLDDDDKYKSRFVVTLTYTRRFGEMDIPFSIVYANKSEFLEGVDKQIGVHVGVKFRALDKE